MRLSNIGFEDKDWSEAPGIVKVLYYLNFIFVPICASLTVFGLFMMTLGMGANPGGIGGTLFFLGLICTALSLVLCRGFRQGAGWAWFLQLILPALGSCISP